MFGGKVKSFDAAKAEKMPGVKKVRDASSDNAVAVVADTWWRAKTALDALAIVWDEGPNAQRLERESIAAMLREGLDAKEAFVGNKAGDADQAIAGAAEEGRGGLFVSVPAPRDDGADERARRVDAGKVRGLDADAERRSRARGTAAKPPACRIDKCDVYTLNLGGGFGRRGVEPRLRAPGGR